jgi:hypothetical protein
MKKLMLVLAMLALVGCGGPSAEQQAKTTELVALIMATSPKEDWAPVHARIAAAELPADISRRLWLLAGAREDSPDILDDRPSAKEHRSRVVAEASRLAPDFLQRPVD